jgi:hypothetical protein
VQPEKEAKKGTAHELKKKEDEYKSRVHSLANKKLVLVWTT